MKFEVKESDDCDFPIYEHYDSLNEPYIYYYPYKQQSWTMFRSNLHKLFRRALRRFSGAPLDVGTHLEGTLNHLYPSYCERYVVSRGFFLSAQIVIFGREGAP